MSAYVRERYGSPETLRLAEVEDPSPDAGEVLVKVLAVSINPADWHSLRGKPLFSRATLGLRRPKHRILGADVAGQVEAVGSSVSTFKPGDEVYADLLEHGYGGFAEYVSVPVEVTSSNRRTCRSTRRRRFRWRGSPHSRAFVTSGTSGPSRGS